MKKILGGVLLALSLALYPSCGKSTSTSLTVLPEEVSAGGCFNLRLLFERLNAFSEDTRGAIYSEAVDVQGEANSRTEFIAFVMHGTFRADEGPWASQKSQASIHLSAADQVDCSSVILYNDGGNPESYEIAAATPTLLMLTQDSTHSTVEISLDSPQSMHIRHTYPVKDFCNHDVAAKVDTTEILHWGSGQDDSRDPVNVSSAFLRQLAISTSVVPEGISTILDSTEGVTARVPLATLIEFRRAPPSPDVFNCPYIPGH